ncbi:MAG: helix-turn-helix domain-containing protein [Muribaculum sp.]|nr:helix-turn-helix domain-containing protein [Muribaculum sp.]
MTTARPTFNDIPELMMALMDKVDRLGELVHMHFQAGSDTDERIWFNVDGLRKYLPSHPRRQTIYSWTSTRRIPFHKKGRSIMFDKDEIDAWLQDSNHMKSDAELGREAEEFINRKRINNKLKK